MKIAYVRVSTIEQNDERQIEGLKKFNIDKWFIEKVSAKDTKRPELESMMEFVREGDTLYIHDLSRLARSTKDLLHIVDILQAKKVELVSNKENIDSKTATGKLMLTMIGAIAEFERANMLERQREGIAIAKSKGVYKGRKKVDLPECWEEIYGQYQTRKITATVAIKEMKLKRTTFYKLAKEYKEKLETNN